MTENEYPRVTEVLKAFTSYSKVPQNILERAAARGTSVHAICAGIAKGAWIPESALDEELKGYVCSFKLWSEAQVKEFMIIEKRYTDDSLKYSGQLDFVVKGSDDNLYLVDLKTSAKPQKTYPIQMAAYENLLNKHHVIVKGAMLVYLNKNGEFPDVHYIEDLEEQMHIFKCALYCWNYFNKSA